MSKFRIPTRAEMLSLMDYERVPGPFDASMFAATEGSYWTISPNARTGNAAQWKVTSASGAVASVSPHYANKAQVRCVLRRGSQSPDWPNERYAPNGNTVRDNATGLTWLRSGANASSHALAVAYCADRVDEGQSWRTPTLKELLTLYTRGRGSIIDTDIFGKPQTSLSSTIAFSELDDVHATDSLYALEEKWGTIRRGRTGGYVRCVQREPSDKGGRADNMELTQVKTLKEYQEFRASELATTGSIEIRNSPLTSVGSLDLIEVEGDLIISGNADLALVSLPLLDFVN